MTEALAAHLEAVLHHALGRGEAPAPVAGDDDAPAGAFVALTVDGVLRALVGSVAPRGPFVATAAEPYAGRSPRTRASSPRAKATR